jgi:hypothetical protein
MRNRLFLGSIRASQLGCPEKGNRNETNWLPVEKNFLLCSLAYLRKPRACINLPKEKGLASSFPRFR